MRLGNFLNPVCLHKIMLQGFSLFITDLGPLRGIWKHLEPTLSLLPGIVKLYSDERSDLRSSG